jgi:hypothetical protein
MYNPNPIYNREYYTNYIPEPNQNLRENDEYLYYIKGEERFNRKYRPTSLNHFDYLSDKISTKIEKDRFKDKVPITFLNNNYNGISQPLDNYYFNRKYNQYNDFYQHNYGRYSKYYNSNGFSYRMPMKYSIKLNKYEKPPINEKFYFDNKPYYEEEIQLKDYDKMNLNENINDYNKIDVQNQNQEQQQQQINQIPQNENINNNINNENQLNYQENLNNNNNINLKSTATVLNNPPETDINNNYKYIEQLPQQPQQQTQNIYNNHKEYYSRDPTPYKLKNTYLPEESPLNKSYDYSYINALKEKENFNEQLKTKERQLMNYKEDYKINNERRYLTPNPYNDIYRYNNYYDIRNYNYNNKSWQYNPYYNQNYKYVESRDKQYSPVKDNIARVHYLTENPYTNKNENLGNTQLKHNPVVYPIDVYNYDRLKNKNNFNMSFKEYSNKIPEMA